jgi:hypothetical protein
MFPYREPAFGRTIRIDRDTSCVRLWMGDDYAAFRKKSVDR